MDSEHYKTMAYSSLNDNEYFEHLEKKILTEQILQKTDRQTQNCLNREKESYLLQFESKNSNFYGLPKVHKSTSSIVIRSSAKTILYISMVNTIDNERTKFAPVCATLVI